MKKYKHSQSEREEHQSSKSLYFPEWHDSEMMKTQQLTDRDLGFCASPTVYLGNTQSVEGAP